MVEHLYSVSGMKNKIVMYDIQSVQNMENRDMGVWRYGIWDMEYLRPICDIQ